MEGLSQDIILKIVFSHALEREGLLLEKYRSLNASIKKNTAVRELLGEFEKEAQEHMTMIRDKMIKLNIQG